MYQFGKIVMHNFYYQ